MATFKLPLESLGELRKLTAVGHCAAIDLPVRLATPA
jgi:hypothetical protein